MDGACGGEEVRRTSGRLAGPRARPAEEAAPQRAARMQRHNAGAWQEERSSRELGARCSAIGGVRGRSRRGTPRRRGAEGNEGRGEVSREEGVGLRGTLAAQGETREMGSRPRVREGVGRLDVRPKRPAVELGLGIGGPRRAGLAGSSLLSSLILFKTENKEKEKGRKKRLEKEFGHMDNFPGLTKFCMAQEKYIWHRFEGLHSNII